MSTVTKWGSYVALGGGTSVRAGVTLSYSPTTVTGSTVSVTVSGSLLLQLSGSSGAFASGTDDWFTSGDHAISGTRTWSLNGNGATLTVATFTKSVTLVYGSSQTFGIAFRVQDVGPSGSDAVVTGANITIPARPVSVPAAPTGADRARVSDTQHTVSWTNNGTTAAPVTNNEVQRWDNVTNAYIALVTTLAGSATSYSDPATRADRRYRYRVRARNSAGSSAWAYTDYVSTTPATPSAAPEVAKNASGGIVVTRPTLSAVAATWDVLHAQDGVWDASPIITGRSVSLGDWTHAGADPTKTHQYRVRAVSGDSPALPGGWSPVSAVVQLQAPPNAPSDLAPQTAQDAAAAITLSWAHNPVDTSPQSAYELEERVVGGSWASTGKVASTLSEHLVPAGTWSNGTVREYRVRTWGEHADPGPWSAPAQVPLSASPTVGLVDITWGSSRLSAGWTFFDPEGTAQSAWEAQLLDGAGDEVDSTAGSGPTAQVTFGPRVDDGATYTVRVRAADGVGLWSAWAAETDVVSYALPPAPALVAAFDRDAGWTVLTVDAPVPGAGEVPVDHLRVDRAVTGGWQTVADALQPGESTLDYLPPTGTLVHYRAVAVSALPSTAASDPVAVDTTTRWVFFNFGPGFGRTVRLWGNLKLDRGYSRAKVLEQYDGREDPVEYAGTARTRTFDLSSVVFSPLRRPDPSSTWEDLLELADAPAPVCVRDPEGLREFVSVGDLSGTDFLARPHRPVSLPLRRVAWVEGEVLP